PRAGAFVCVASVGGRFCGSVGSVGSIGFGGAAGRAGDVFQECERDAAPKPPWTGSRRLLEKVTGVRIPLPDARPPAHRKGRRITMRPMAVMTLQDAAGALGCVPWAWRSRSRKRKG